LRGATCVSPFLMRNALNFNPRAPCGARRGGAIAPPLHFIFQPTRPLRGATSPSSSTGYFTDFNPRAPCGARPFGYIAVTHFEEFQPTRPLRGAT